jgi:excisionase family DNA binding protein
VASYRRPRRRRAANGAVKADSGIERSVSELGRVQNRHLKIPVHYEGDLAFLGMNGAFMRLIDSEALASLLGVEIVFVRRLVAERRIPFLKIGKFVRFDPDEVAMWIDDQRIAAVRAAPRRSGRW